MTENSHPKSATSSSKNQEKPKWMNGKTDAMKEIESWATGGKGQDGLGQDMARMSGQLTDNVTEQRMLQSKLFELSKERYKFLSQSSYDRKVFIDRQMRKTNVMKDLMRGVSLDPNRPSSSQSGRKRRYSNARMALLDRLDPTKGRNSPTKKIQSLESAKKLQAEQQNQEKEKQLLLTDERPHSIANPCLHGGGKHEITLLHPPKTPPVFSTEPKVRKNRSKSCDIDGKLPNITSPSTPTVRFASDHESRRPGTRMSIFGGRRSAMKWRNPGSAKSDPGGPVTDQRYICLEKCLCPPYIVNNGIPDIPMLIQRIESLHIPPRKPKENKQKKTQLKIQEFMRERGIVF